MNMTVPMKKMAKFKDWLATAGAEILAPTNEWEVLRFKANGKVNVVYRNARGVLNFGSCDESAVKAFMSGGGWSAGIEQAKRARRPSHIRALLQRDGDYCFLCGFPMDDDLTVEHLVPIAHGGPNHLSNMALAHSRCNLLLGGKSVMEKIKLREHHQNWSAQQ